MREALRAIFDTQLREGHKKIGDYPPEEIEIILESSLTYLDGTLKDFFNDGIN